MLLHRISDVTLVVFVGEPQAKGRAVAEGAKRLLAECSSSQSTTPQRAQAVTQRASTSAPATPNAVQPGNTTPPSKTQAASGKRKYKAHEPENYDAMTVHIPAHQALLIASSPYFKERIKAFPPCAPGTKPVIFEQAATLGDLVAKRMVLELMYTRILPLHCTAAGSLRMPRLISALMVGSPRLCVTPANIAVAQLHYAVWARTQMVGLKHSCKEWKACKSVMLTIRQAVVRKNYLQQGVGEGKGALCIVRVKALTLFAHQ